MITLTGTTKELKAFAAGCMLLMLSAACLAGPVITEMDIPDTDIEEVAMAYIVQASSAEAAANAVKAVGGSVTHEVTVLHAVGATLFPAQAERLRVRQDVLRVFEDAAARTPPL